MADLPIPGAPPGGPPPAGAGTAPGQPPFGPSPMTMPAPNAGLKAAALAQLGWAVRIMEKSLPMLGVGTDEGKAVMKALTSLSKMVPPGSASPGVEQNALQQLMTSSKQEQPMQMLQAARLGAGGGAPPPAAPTPPPMAA